MRLIKKNVCHEGDVSPCAAILWTAPYDPHGAVHKIRRDPLCGGAPRNAPGCRPKIGHPLSVCRLRCAMRDKICPRTGKWDENLLEEIGRVEGE